MDVHELRPGLWRWTAPHPDWTPDDGGPNGWEREVASYLWSAGGELVLFDPLVPAAGTDDAARFSAALDRDVAQHGTPHVLLTVYWHARSAQQIHDRYSGARVWAHERAAEDARERTVVTDPFSADGRLPGGVEAIEAVGGSELLYWIPEARALVAGDALLGTAGGGVRVCPDSWLGDRTTPEALREELSQVLELPVELLLPTHGEAVVRGAREALQAALNR